jgi:hypothetical protein
MSTDVTVVEPEKKEVVQKSPGMQMHEGRYTLETIQEQMTYGQWLIDKKLVSDTFKTPAQLVVAIQLCKDLGLPNSALSCFYVVGGKPAIYGDVLIGLVMELVEDKQIIWFDEEATVIEIPKKGQKFFGCKVGYKRKGFASYVYGTYTLDDKEASRTTNPTWIKFEKDMLWRRADVRAVKALFPDAMKGIEVVDYLEDMDGIKTLKNDTADKARMLTEKFSEENINQGAL